MCVFFLVFSTFLFVRLPLSFGALFSFMMFGFLPFLALPRISMILFVINILVSYVGHAVSAIDTSDIDQVLSPQRPSSR